MERFFKTTSTQSLITKFEQLGYKFEKNDCDNLEDMNVDEYAKNVKKGD